MSEKRIELSHEDVTQLPRVLKVGNKDPNLDRRYIRVDVESWLKTILAMLSIIIVCSGWIVGAVRAHLGLKMAEVKIERLESTTESTKILTTELKKDVDHLQSDVRDVKHSMERIADRITGGRAL